MLNRRFSQPSMWDEMERVQREMNRLFNNTFMNRPSLPIEFPAINLWAGNDGVILTAEIPGASPEDIEIGVVGQTVTLAGKRELDKAGEGTRYHRQERQSGQFSRSIELPFSVDPNKVQARFDKGVLVVNLPRVEAEKPKKITVKASA
jgi:HSP20 family protein